MNGLSLFSGGGISELAFKHIIPNYQTVGYVDNDEYCCKIIEARIKDGILDDAPIWQVDIREFNRKIAPIYKGNVNWISGGFPCQPFSVAGRQLGASDQRNLWPEMRDSISIIRSEYVFLENVANLINHPYIWRIVSDLSTLGYYFEGDTFGAGSIGAPYPKRRLWILCTLSGCDGLQSRNRKYRKINEKIEIWERSEFERLLRNQLQLAVPAGKRGRMAVRVADRMDRIKAAGNGWVPQVVKRILQVKEPVN